MTVSFNWKNVWLASSILVLAACGGGGGGGGSGSTGGGGSNSAPAANAGSDQSVDEQSTVTLDGSASTDPDGNTLSFVWTQTGGETVSISGSNSVQASFSSPDVGVGSSVDLTFELRVSDGSAINADTVVVTVNGVTNSDPVADAGSDRLAAQQSTIVLVGSAVDPDLGDTLTYSWTQLSGTAATITDGDTPNASIGTPSVQPGGETLTFELTVSDGIATATDTVDVDVQQTLAAINVSGKLTFEFANPNSSCRGLDLTNPVLRDMRGVPVQILDAANNVLAETTSGSDGSYSFSNVPASTDVRIRARAELQSSGPATWDVQVIDNVDTSLNPPSLSQRPLYVTQWPLFNTGTGDILDADFTATTGWDASSGVYTGDRAAAPFAILYAILKAMETVADVDPTVTFPELDVYWSVNNTLAAANDVDNGELTTSFYTQSGLYLLGDANVDTEEFDELITVHEWGHYFEDVLSRSDSLGGRHAIGEPLDLRLAFSEGFASALASIALDNPTYCDTSAPMLTGRSLFLDMEFFNSGVQGWFNEGSIATLIYDLWDTNVDGSDDGSIGFAPIYETMVGPHRTTAAFTTIFSFAAELRPMLDPAQLAFVDSQLNRENIDTPSVTVWGDGQQSIPSGMVNGGRDVVPVYTEVPTDGSVANVCVNNDYLDTVDGVFNKLSDWRYLRFETPVDGRWTITVTANPAPPPTSDGDPNARDDSDPDFYVWQGDRLVAFGEDVVPTEPPHTETVNTMTLAAGDYAVELVEYRYVDDQTASDFPSQVCYDVTIAPF